jgi:hypothetical protein
MNAVRAEIDKLRSAYEAAVATGRIEEMLPLLAEGAVMVHPGAPDWKAMEAAAAGAPFAFHGHRMRRRVRFRDVLLSADGTASWSPTGLIADSRFASPCCLT